LKRKILVKMNFKKLFSWRIYVLILFLFISLIAINPTFKAEGAAIKNVETNSSVTIVGIQSPSENVMPRGREVILNVNGQDINDIEDYSRIIKEIKINEPVEIVTNKRTYDPFLKTSEDIGIVVDKVATSNIKKGLELAGGTRVLLKPIGEVTEQDIENAKDSISYRLNVYGLSDIDVRSSNDLMGNKYILIEIAGATKEEVKDLVAKQGKFEAKIGDEIVFIGGQRDVTFVCRNDGTCSGIRNCAPIQDGYNCIFEFAIQLSPEAAKRHAEITKDMDTNISESGKEYLSEMLVLYLDDNEVDRLQISADLKGKETQDIAISGPGFDKDEQGAVKDAIKNMNKLQTVLITGSLPFKLEIVKMDSISPTLGTMFVKNAFFVGLLAILAVSLIVFIRYRKLKIALPMLFSTLSEVIILLGFAALIRYNLDLAAIAGIIAAVGTGVDHKIVITDEVLKGGESYYNWKEKIKRAFFIILVAYATTVAAMLPLLKAGAGLLTGFAVVTIIGVTIGVLITRPAFASIIEKLIKE